MSSPELKHFLEAVRSEPTLSRMTKHRYEKRWPHWVLFLLEHPTLVMALCRDLKETSKGN